MDPLAPPVVAVVVACDPGPWFEETLSTLGAQDYPDLSILVLDSASEVDLTPRVAAQLPGAFVRRLRENRGYAAAANEALDAVEGATHLLFCHDDVAPEPGAVRAMVEEAYRSNAGIVTPKLVDWSDGSRLMQVGMAADKAGAPSPRVEPGELDQEQHDAVRDVFVAPGGFTLVRADLFSTLGGFDDRMALFGEDLDLSWRAQVAGARVVVAPAARVRHLEAASTGRRDLPPGLPGVPGRRYDARPAGENGRGRALESPQAEVSRNGRGTRGRSPGSTSDLRFGLERRNELRAVLKDYSLWHLARVLPQLIFLDACEVVYDTLLGRASKSGAIVRAWGANLSSLSEIREARRDVSEYRLVPDSEVRRLQARGSARLSGFLRSQVLSAGGLHRGAVGRGGRGEENARAPAPATPSLLAEPSFRAKAIFWAVAAVVLAYGTRQLISSPLPVVGQLAHLPGAGTLLQQFAAGWRTAGLGSQSSPPAGFGLLGLGGVVTLGSTGLLQKILFLGSLPVGAIGAYRMARPLPAWPRMLAALAYLAIPLGYNAIEQGHLQAMLVVAASPWILSRLMRATGLDPFYYDRPLAAVEAGQSGSSSSPQAGKVPWRSLARQAVSLGLIVALLSALVPAGFIVTFLTTAALSLVTVLSGRTRPALSALGVGLGAIVVAGALTFPWSLTLISPGAQLAALTGLGYSPSQILGLGAVMRFQTGGLGGAPVGWVFVLAGCLPLLIGRRWRLVWAARLWGVALAVWGLAWICSRGWLGASVPPPDILLAPAAAAMSLAIALGLVAFGRDLPRYNFGWRQVATLLAGACVALGCLPVLSNAIGGRWDLPSQGYDQALSFLPAASSSGAYRVLWLGAPATLPLQGWRLTTEVSYGTSESGVPDGADLLPYPDPGSTSLLGRAVDAAWRGQTSQLGHLLATFSVRYIVVPSSSAPPVGSAQGTSSPPPPSLTSALLAQDDLRQLNTDPGLVVLENVAWVPERALLTPGAAADSLRQGISTSARVAGSRAVLPGAPGSLSFSGTLRPGLLFSSTPSSTSWNLVESGQSGGRTLQPRTAFGWASSYPVRATGTASLMFDPPAVRYAAVALELLLWLVAVAGLLWRRRAVPGRLEGARGVAADPGVETRAPVAAAREGR